ncbi:MAG: GyrI-like domain-containing protein [Flavobacteriales bacterium]
MVSTHPQIIEMQPKRLMGVHARLSYSSYNVVALWQQLMPRRKELQGVIGEQLFSVQYFSTDFFKNFSPTNPFDKWSAVEIGEDAIVPTDWVELTLEGGLYAVFAYKGDESGAAEAFQYILGVWLPNSEYQLDDRKHFEILDHRYKRNDPNSEEDIYIPVRLKA